MAGGIECGPQLIPELMEGTIADLNLVNLLPSVQKKAYDSCLVELSACQSQYWILVNIDFSLHFENFIP